MPKKKKPQRNAFYWFMQDLLPEYRRAGKVFPNGIADVVPLALPRWKELSPLEKESYERRAREEKKKAKLEETNQYKLDNTGNIISMKSKENIIKKERVDKVEEKEKRRIREGKTSRSRWPLADEEFLDMPFYFISFEYYWESEDSTSLPVEVALVEFSLRRGITRSYQQFIKPSDERHQVPVDDFELADSNYRGIWIQIENFVNPNGSKSEYPPIYAMDEEVKNVQYCLKWLHTMACVGTSNRLQKVFELENMVVDLFIRAKKEVPRAFISKLLGNTNFDYEVGVRCEWHEEQDTRFCALGTVNKYCFIMADALADPFNFELTPSHLPQQSEAPVTLITSSSLRQPSSSGYQLPAPSFSGPFASRDIRYKHQFEEEEDFPPLDDQEEDIPTLRRPMIPPQAHYQTANPWSNQKQTLSQDVQKPTLRDAVASKQQQTSQQAGQFGQRPTLHEAVAKSQRQTLHEAVANSQRPTLHEVVANSQRPTLHEAVAKSQRQTLHEAVANSQRRTLHEAVANDHRPTLRQAVEANRRPTLHEAVAEKQNFDASSTATGYPNSETSSATSWDAQSQSFHGKPAGRGAGRGRGNSMMKPRVVNAPGTCPTTQRPNDAPSGSWATGGQGMSMKPEPASSSASSVYSLEDEEEEEEESEGPKLRKPSTVPRTLVMAAQKQSFGVGRGYLYGAIGRGDPTRNAMRPGVKAEPGSVASESAFSAVESEGRPEGPTLRQPSSMPNTLRMAAQRKTTSAGPGLGNQGMGRAKRLLDLVPAGRGRGRGLLSVPSAPAPGLCRPPPGFARDVPQ